MKTLALFAVLSLCSFSLPAFAEDKVPAPPAGVDKNAAREEAKKAQLEFMRQERGKRWEFEEKLLQANRQHEDEMRKAHHDADLEDEAAISTATDLKAARKAVSDKRRERQKAWREKTLAHHKQVGEMRKAFRAQADADRKAFKDAHKR